VKADWEELESLLTSLRHDLNQKTAEVRMIYAQRDERVKEIAELECTVGDLQDDQDESLQSRDQLVQDLADVEKEILVKEKELKEILPKLTTTKDKETKIKQRYFVSYT
jgi:chromosome segregation ATPase